MRIATLLPSATDIVCSLGLQQSLIGISHSCDQPDGISPLPRLTSTRVPTDVSSQEIDDFVRDYLNSAAQEDDDTSQPALYELNMAELERAAPDVIISQGLCDVCAVSTGDVKDALCSLPSLPTLIDLNPNTLSDVLTDIRNVGEMLGHTDRAKQCIEQLQHRIDRVASAYQQSDTAKPRVAFLEWLIPPFNGGHWNPELVELAGGIDLLGNLGIPSVTLSDQQVFDSDPDVLMIACCGYSIPRTREDIALCLQKPEWQDFLSTRKPRTYLADGQDYFARPSPALVDALERLAVTLHPDIQSGVNAQAFDRL